jgi:hypothetical protein
VSRYSTLCPAGFVGPRDFSKASGRMTLPVAQAASLIFTHNSEHARLKIPMDLRALRAFSPPRPASGRGGRGVSGRALTWKPQVQWFVYASATQLNIEFMIKKPIKTQCKTPRMGSTIWYDSRRSGKKRKRALQVQLFPIDLHPLTYSTRFDLSATELSLAKLCPHRAPLRLTQRCSS